MTETMRLLGFLRGGDVPVERMVLIGVAVAAVFAIVLALMKEGRE